MPTNTTLVPTVQFGLGGRQGNLGSLISSLLGGGRNPNQGNQGNQGNTENQGNQGNRPGNFTINLGGLPINVVGGQNGGVGISFGQQGGEVYCCLFISVDGHERDSFPWRIISHCLDLLFSLLLFSLTGQNSQLVFLIFLRYISFQTSILQY